MFVRQSNAFMEIEFDDTGVSTLVRSYTEDDFGLEALAGVPPGLSGDGTAALVLGSTTSGSGFYYFNRQTPGDRFGPPTLVSDVPGPSDPFMTENCERLYFSGLGNVFWLQQL